MRQHRTKFFLPSILLIAALLFNGCSARIANSNQQDNSHSAQVDVTANNTSLQGETFSLTQQPTGSGEIVYEAEISSLSSQQETLLHTYMDRYYLSLATLQMQQLDDLFCADAQQALWANDTVWQYLIGVRSMQQTDLSLLSYHYELTVLDWEEQEDETIRVMLREDNTQQFACSPDVSTQGQQIFHLFELCQQDGNWYLHNHRQFDSLYQTVLGDPRDEQEVEDPENYYTALLQQMLQTAQEDTAQRAQQGEELSLPVDHAYDRQAAVEYANMWVGQRNEDWADYSMYGGNCQNFVSQVLYASGIPMDVSGEYIWKWYGTTPSESNNRAGRSSSWSGVEAFMEYAIYNTGYGLAANVDAPYYTGQIGDIIHLGDEDGWQHTVVIVGLITDEQGNTVDYLVNSNTADLVNFPVSAYAYTRQMLIQIFGWNEG